MTLHRGWTLAPWIGLIPILALLAPKALAPLLIIIILVAIAITKITKQYVRIMPWALIVALSLFVIWGGISSFWAPVPLHSLKRAVSLAAMLCGTAITTSVIYNLDARDRRLVDIAMVGGLLIALLLHTEEIFSQAYLIRFLRSLSGLSTGDQVYDRFATVTAILLWPTLITAWHYGWKITCVALVGLASITFWETYNQSSQVAFVVGAVIFIVMYLVPKTKARILIRTLGGLAVAGILVAPLLPKTILQPERIASYGIFSSSAVHRTVIWDKTVDWIPKRPLTGQGLGAARFLTQDPEKQTFYIKNYKGSNLKISSEDLALHTHNEMLQIWVELGFVGALITAIVAWICLCRPEKRHYLPMSYAILSVAAFSYGAWQSWWLAAIFLTIMFSIQSKTVKT